MAAVNNYLNTGNLHFNPLCMRVERCVGWIATKIRKIDPSNSFTGDIASFFSMYVFLGGVVLLSPLAAIETVGSLLFGLIGLNINYIFCNSKSEFWQKHSLKSLAYSLNSFLSVVAPLFILLVLPRLNLLKYHAGVALFDHITHVGSALFVQTYLGRRMDEKAGRDPAQLTARKSNLLIEAIPSAFSDLFIQLQRDVGTIRGELEQNRLWTNFLAQDEAARNFVDTIEFSRFIGDQNYRLEAMRVARRYAIHSQLISQAQGNQGVFVLNQYSREVEDYQNNLSKLLKNGFIEMHQMDSFRDKLESLDGEIFPTLTALTVLKELEGEIVCPKSFTGKLAQYNSRNAQLTAAKADLAAMAPNEKEELRKKIFEGGNFNASVNVQALYLKISALAAPLYQGPLMTRTAINAEGGDFANMLDVVNLFQGACQEALAEVSK